MKSLLKNSLVVLSSFAVAAGSQSAQAGHGHMGGGLANHASMFHSKAGSRRSSRASFAHSAKKQSLANTGIVQTGNVTTGNGNKGNINTGNVQTGAAGKGTKANANTGGVTTGNVKTGNNNSGNINTGNVTTGNAGKGAGKGTGKGAGNTTTGGVTTGDNNSGTINTGTINETTINKNDGGGFGGGGFGGLLGGLGGSGGGFGGDGGGFAGDGGFAGGDAGFAPAPAADPTPAPALAAPADLQPIDIKQMDAGVPSENLGARYRITVANNGATNVNQEFTVALMASNSPQPAASLPGSLKRVSGLNAGDTTTVDVRLPEGVSAPYLVISVDSEHEVSDAQPSNNLAVMSADAVPSAR